MTRNTYNKKYDSLEFEIDRMINEGWASGRMNAYIVDDEKKRATSPLRKTSSETVRSN